MSKVACMQPYLFPYFGYFQLAHAVDDYVFLDDVSYIKKGFINRNQLMINNKLYKFTIPVDNVSQNKKINQHIISIGWTEKLIKTITHGYSKSLYFRKYENLIFALIEQCSGNNFYDAASHIVETLCKELGITTRFHSSSDFMVEDFKAEKKIIEICKDFDATMYINPIGGLDLDFYQQEYFDPIDLRFIKRKDSLSNLSIIDLLFTQDIEYIKEQLNEYELVTK